MSLSAKIFLGLGLGIVSGLFLGEITAPLKMVGDAYVQLLQMAVLPYIMIALISGLGMDAALSGIHGSGAAAADRVAADLWDGPRRPRAARLRQCPGRTQKGGRDYKETL
jgi:hypothetical protein